MKKKKFINLIYISSILFSLFCLVYTIYRSYFFFNSAREEHYYIYLFIFSVALIFFIVTFFFNDDFKENILVSSISLLFIFYITELFLIIFLNDNNYDKAKKERLLRHEKIYKEYNLKTEYRSKVEYLDYLKSKDIDVSLMITPMRINNAQGVKNKFSKTKNVDDIILPLGGSSFKKLIGSSETGKFNIYKTDRYGFNNSDNLWNKKIDIMLFGDSAVHFDYLPEKFSWSSNLRQLLNKNILSLGMSNNGPLLNLATFIEYAKTKKPSKILWFYIEENDLLEIKIETKSKILKKYLYENFDQDLINNQNLIDLNIEHIVSSRVKFLDNQNESEKKVNLLTFLKLQKLRNLFFSNLNNHLANRVNHQDLRSFNEIIKKLKFEADKFKCDIHVIYLPAQGRFFENHKSFLKKKDYYKRDVLNIFKKNNIKVVDLYELYFKNHPDPQSTLFFRMPSHYNKDTIAELSKKVAEFLK
jgi:hypothetical protein